jgi:hypothetical protein
VHPVRLGHSRESAQAGATTRSVAATSPDDGRPMGVPVLGGVFPGPTDRRPGLHAPPLHGPRAPSVPPRLNQVPGGRLLGLEDELPAGVRPRAQQASGGPVGTQVTHDRREPPECGGHPVLHAGEGRPRGGRGAAGGGHGQRLASGRPEGPEALPFAAAAVIAPGAGPSCGPGQRVALSGPISSRHTTARTAGGAVQSVVRRPCVGRTQAQPARQPPRPAGPSARLPPATARQGGGASSEALQPGPWLGSAAAPAQGRGPAGPGGRAGSCAPARPGGPAPCGNGPGVGSWPLRQPSWGADVTP